MEKLIDITDRVPTRKRKRRIRTNIKFTVLITIFLICIFFLLYFQSSYSKVNEIKLSGNVLFSYEQYIELIDIEENQSMWSFKPEELEKSILQLKWIKSATVKRDWLTTVSITIEESPKVAYISENSTFYPILENGYVFIEELSDLPIDAPVFLQFDDEELRKRLLKQLANLKPEVLALISQINAAPSSSDPYSIILYMNDGYEVRAEITTLASKLNYYPSIVAQIEQEEQFEKGIIDIEVGSYYRPYSGEYNSLEIDGLEEGQANDESEGVDEDVE